MGTFDPTTTLSPDDPLQEWLKDPAMADFVRQKALEHAQNVLGYTGEGGSGQETGAITGATPPVPQFDSSIPPTSIFGRIKAALGPGENPDPTAAQGPYVMDKGAPTNGVGSGIGKTPEPLPDYGQGQPYSPGAKLNPLDPEENPSPVAEGTVPLPKPRPGDTDVSAQKKQGDAGASDFMKALAGVKAIQPPPLNPVGTPAVRSPGAINAPQLAQILSLLGAQTRPDPVQTLGRLLVAGKA